MFMWGQFSAGKGYGLVWIRMKSFARELGKSIYSVKFGLVSDYMRAQLAKATIRFA